MTIKLLILFYIQKCLCVCHTSVSRMANMSCLWKRMARWTRVKPTSNAEDRLRRCTSSAVSCRAMSPPDDL